MPVDASQKKIVLLSPAHPLRGGIAASSERLAQALQAAGYTVVIYSFALQYPAFLFPGATQYTSDPPPAQLDIRTRINSINPFNWLAVGWAIAQERPHRVVVRFWMPFMGPSLGTIVRVAKWFCRTHITAVVDNIIPHERRAGDRLLARYFTAACHDFVVMARAVGEEVRQFSNRPVRYAPHPVYDIYGVAEPKQTARATLGLPTKAPVVLFFGLIRAYKGLDLLLEALAKPTVAQLGVQALIVGEPYEDWTPYQALIDQYELAQCVHLHLHYVPNAAVARYFSAADLVVQPYKTATQSGISQIAYHFDKPMVVTNVGGLPEIVQHGESGYVVPPTAEDIAKAITDFFQHQRANTMIPNVQAAKSRFSWQHLAKVVMGATS